MSSLVKSALVAATFTGCVLRVGGDGPFDEQDSQSVALPADLTQLTLEVPAGNLSVSPGANVGVQAELSWRSGDGPPFVTVQERGTAVTHTWRCDGNRSCSVDLVITVPPSTDAVTLDLEAGDVELTDLSGPLLVDVEAGNVDILGHTGDVDIDVEAGSIVARELRADEVVASVEAGSIDLELANRPVEIDATTDAGDVDLRVPSGAYALDLRTSVGQVRVGEGIIEDPGADASIRARVEVGSVRIDGF